MNSISFRNLYFEFFIILHQGTLDHLAQLFADLWILETYVTEDTGTGCGSQVSDQLEYLTILDLIGGGLWVVDLTFVDYSVSDAREGYEQKHDHSGEDVDNVPNQEFRLKFL